MKIASSLTDTPPVKKKKTKSILSFFFSKSSESRTVSKSAETNIVDQPPEPVPGRSSIENPQAPDQDKNSSADTQKKKKKVELRFFQMFIP